MRRSSDLLPWDRAFTLLPWCWPLLVVPGYLAAWTRGGVLRALHWSGAAAIRVSIAAATLLVRTIRAPAGAR